MKMNNFLAMLKQIAVIQKALRAVSVSRMAFELVQRGASAPRGGAQIDDG